MNKKFVSLGLCAICFFSVACDKPHARESAPRDHAGADGVELEPHSYTIFGERLQLFLEHPPLILGKESAFLVHLTVLVSGEPIRRGVVRLSLVGGDEQTLSTETPEPRREGIFIPTVTPKAAGVVKASVAFSNAEISETFDLGAINIYENEAQALKAQPEKEAVSDEIPFLLEQQWPIKLLTAPVEIRTLRERIRVPGTVEALPEGSVVVSAPLAGRLRPPPSGGFLAPGKVVKKGQVIAELELTPETAKRIRETEVKLAYAKKQLSRATELRAKGVGAAQQYDEARQAATLAEGEYKSAFGAGAEPPRKSDADSDSADSASTLPIIAPRDGEITSAPHIENTFIEAHQELCRILDTSRMWVVAQLSEYHLLRIDHAPSAFMTLDAYNGRRFEITGGGGRLVNIGSVIDQSSRTLPIRFQVPNPSGELRVGMFANVFLEVKEATSALSIPEAAVVMDGGQPTAYVLLDAETFQKRRLELGIRDESFVEVKSGLKPEERVVSSGAYAVKLAALSPASFGQGHVH